MWRIVLILFFFVFFQSFDGIEKFEQPSLAIVGYPAVLVFDIAGHSINFENISTGLEVFFAYHFALNIEYLNECRVIWIFIQKYIFGIHTSYDQGPSNQTLAKDLGLIQ